MPQLPSGTPRPHGVARQWPLVAAGASFGLVAVLTLAIVCRGVDRPFGFESRWMGAVVEHRTQPWTALALAFNYVGGGIMAFTVVPVLVIVGLLLLRRPWGALYYGVATVACLVVVQLLKHVVARPRPSSILVQADLGSFPSGHSANAAVMAATLAIVLPHLSIRIAGAVYTLGMMLSRTYLGAHWILDVIGGLLIGIGIAVALWVPLAVKFQREHPRLATGDPPVGGHQDGKGGS